MNLDGMNQGIIPGAEAQEPKWAVTTIRLLPAQAVALRQAATEQWAARAGRVRFPGKADASDVLRQLVDAWLAGKVEGMPPPAGLRREP